MDDAAKVYPQEFAAAKDYVNNVSGYSGSVEALGLNNAFFYGALLKGSSDNLKLMEAFIAGLKFTPSEG